MTEFHAVAEEHLMKPAKFQLLCPPGLAPVQDAAFTGACSALISS